MKLTVAHLALTATRPVTPQPATALHLARLIALVTLLRGLGALSNAVEAHKRLGSFRPWLPSMVARIVNMVNLRKSHGIATLMHAHKCVLVHGAPMVHAMLTAPVAPSLAASSSCAQLLAEVLNVKPHTVTSTQLNATHTIAQMVMFAPQCKRAGTRMVLFSDGEVDIDALRF